MKRAFSLWVLGAFLTGSIPAPPAPAHDLEIHRNAPGDFGGDAEDFLVEAGFRLDPGSLANVLLDERQNPEIRHWAAIALGQRGEEGAAKALETALESEHIDVRLGAVLGLGELGGAAALPGLTQARQDSSGSVRAATMTALGKVGGPAAAGLLAKSLRDADELETGVRVEAAAQLGRSGLFFARQPLFDSLEDPQALVRGASAVALARLGDARALPALVTVALDPLSQEWLRVDAIEALEDSSGERFGYVKPYHAPSSPQEKAAALEHVRQWSRGLTRPAPTGSGPRGGTEK